MMFRFFILPFMIAALVTVAAQTRAEFENLEDMANEDVKQEVITLDEYNNIPPGLLMPPDVNTQTSTDPLTVPNDGSSTTVITDSNVHMTYESALELYRAGKYADIIPSIEFLSKNGHDGATELLGIMNRLGQGMPKNTVRAIDILTKMAQENRPLSQHHLGIMYFLGEGLETTDMTRALMWLHLAIVYYPEGLEKERARRDRAAIYARISRRDKDAALQMAREWLMKKGEGHLVEQ